MIQKLTPLVLGVLLIAIAVTLSIYYLNPFFRYNDPKAVLDIKQDNRHFELFENGKEVVFNLVDPEQSPPDIHDKVILGYNIMNDTKKFAPKYAGDAITCTQCHISGGNTLGGRNGGISLVGVGKWYPSFSKRHNKVISLKERINDCFERSLSGKPAPEDSPEMDALLAYLDWISFPVKNIKETPWRGLPDIKISHKPDPKRGAEVYERFCSSCHMQNGQGNQSYPPLWGSESFNSGAGMNRVETLAGFTYYNMPYQTPMLTKQESLDVAAYITSQDRPKLK